MRVIPENRRVQRLLKFVGAVVAVVVLVWVGAMIWQPIRLTQIYKEIDALGIPLSPEEIAPPPLADEDNAALLYIKANRLFNEGNDTEQALKLVLEANEMAEVQWLDLSEFPRIDTRHLDILDFLNDHLSSVAHDAANAGDEISAWRYAIANLKFANSYGQMHLLFHAPQKHLIDRQAVSCVVSLLQRKVRPGDLAAELRDELDRLCDRNRLAEIIDLEIAIRNAKFRDSRSSRILLRPLLFKKHGDALESLLLMRKLSEKRFYAVHEDYVPVGYQSGRFRPFLFNGDLNSRLNHLLTNFDAIVAECELLEISIAAQAFIDDLDRNPLTIEALIPDYLAEVPIDPFSGEPYIYVFGDQRFRLRSVGKNGIDDHENPDDIWAGKYTVEPASS